MINLFLKLASFCVIFCTAIDIEAQESKGIKDIKVDDSRAPEYLYKIVSTDQWQESLRRHEIVTSLQDKEFIHLAKEEQVAQIAQKFWNSIDHVILKLASNKLIGRLAYETNPGGTNKYYHLYDGNIPFEAVKDISIIKSCADEP